MPGRCTPGHWLFHLDFAHLFRPSLTLGERDLDEGEFIDVPVSDLLQACRDGRITDAQTLACGLWLQNVHSGAWSLAWQADAGAD